ncbi:hypothetical protein [Actibacterium sp. MT2.3-13A]|uniref:hypothetical protein n=1 Tax=Actibacterium sp. MT2.3-13A TaxID=2828332 RepID=UPI001BA8FC63|nr:hypothetical protein [Actibacterium sp. MT2.3-13A]
MMALMSSANLDFPFTDRLMAGRVPATARAGSGPAARHFPYDLPTAPDDVAAAESGLRALSGRAAIARPVACGAGVGAAQGMPFPIGLGNHRAIGFAGPVDTKCKPRGAAARENPVWPAAFNDK